ncbi:MAG: arsenite methyltransferase [Mycobacterium sp.]|jgi:arsenite methyltransferase|nr:arsenite methyltransferase [Mycobacterium sp.]MDT5191624.1 arsenite methyltransferase [Mycobacterium sp.]MDT5288777.1 arsenite methyltransferase [Mycobacterium sp.]
MASLRDRLLSTVAGQLGRPHGLLSPLVARVLNRGNERAIAAAVDSAEIARGSVAADIGFGGGIGLRLLLDRVGDQGVVHGIEIADDMLRRARSRFGRDVQSGRLLLSSGSMTALPLGDGSVDALITLNTVYFISELDAACAELARVLRPGGRAVIGIGDPDVMARLPFAPHGFTIRPVGEIAAALQNSGLQVEQRRIGEKPMPRYLFVGSQD